MEIANAQNAEQQIDAIELKAVPIPSPLLMRIAKLLNPVAYSHLTTKELVAIANEIDQAITDAANRQIQAQQPEG
jgi:hypothetical protein